MGRFESKKRRQIGRSFTRQFNRKISRDAKGECAV